MMRIYSGKVRYEPRSVNFLAVCFLLLALWIIVRLAYLQIVQHEYYQLFATNTHEIYERIHPKRGTIFFQDVRSKEEFPAAVNRAYYQVYIVPREIPGDKIAYVGETLSGMLSMDADKKANLLVKLGKSKSAYEAIQKKVPEDVMEKIEGAKLPGVYSTAEEYRFYPEESSGANMLGFARFNDKGILVGQYGVEGYWNDLLTGRVGYLNGEQGATGNWISLATRKTLPAEPGADLLLTIDRSLQFKACERLRQGMVEYQAEGGALILLNPKTGAILAMCSLPDYDPNEFSKVTDVGAFNNTAIFGAYEPGSVFKPIAMAAAIDQNLVQPSTSYTDPCERKIDRFTIKNAEGRCWGTRTMTEVLMKSINTGMIFVEEKLGVEKFKEYIKRFGFGVKTGVALNVESSGDISSLDKKSPVYGATASFGQGVTVTPMQIAVAYGAIANQGKLMRPHIVEEVRHPNGKKEVIEPDVLETVLSPRTSNLLSAMLVAVVDNYGKRAHVPGYYVAGKTGTAQIAGKGGYSADITNQTFAGFAPANNPQLVLVVKYEKPNTQWAELAAGPVFSDVMKFALEYYGIPKER